jgi:hypothetical protein
MGRAAGRIDWATAALITLGLVVIWLPARPPMVDLPQHGAQLALLRDLVLGRSPWADQVHVNVFTPYLLGYCLALPIALIAPPLVAMKLVLSGAFVAFVAACRSIRAALGASARLDALFCIPFFGFAYSWGFYTFLVAAPVGLLFIRVAIGYGREPRLRAGLLLAALGVAMLFCHGLVFLFAFAVSGAIMLANTRSVMDLVRRSWPFAAAAVFAVALFMAMRANETQISNNFGQQLQMSPLARRIAMLATNSVDAPPTLWPRIATDVLLALPLLGGLALNRRREALAIAGAVAVMMVFAPSFAWSTGYLFERLVLFMLPAYAWLFVDPPQPRAWRLPGPALALACAVVAAGVLVKHAADGVAFSNEAKDFDRVMAAAQPRQRALMLPFDRASQVQVGDEAAYLHFPAWYAAERQGFVDFSFAYFHPEMVRFNTATLPPVRDDLEWFPESFDWTRLQAWRYRYFFVRSRVPLAPRFFAPGQPRLLARSGEWSLYENAAPALAARASQSSPSPVPSPSRP